ncbi:hypothetical protein D3C71_1717330 [compost metagenome]
MSANGTKSSYQRSLPDLSPPISRIAARLGSKAYNVRSGRPPACVLSSRMCSCPDPLMPLECGNPNVVPRSSKRPTVAATDSCSPSDRLFHQTSNSSVNSTSQAIDFPLPASNRIIAPKEYSIKGISAFFSTAKRTSHTGMKPSPSAVCSTAADAGRSSCMARKQSAPRPRRLGSAQTAP